MPNAISAMTTVDNASSASCRTSQANTPDSVVFYSVSEITLVSRKIKAPAPGEPFGSRGELLPDRSQCQSFPKPGHKISWQVPCRLPALHMPQGRARRCLLSNDVRGAQGDERGHAPWRYARKAGVQQREVSFVPNIAPVKPAIKMAADDKPAPTVSWRII